MPEVPRYGRPRVQQAPLPGLRLSPEAPVANFQPAIQAAQGLLQDRIKVEQEQLEKANALKMSEERRFLNEWEYKNVYDPTTGAINKVGRNALGIHETLGKDYKTFIDEREKTLVGADQKAAFRAMAEARFDHIMRWAQGHVGTQTRVLEEAEFGASVESSKERASVDNATIPLELAIIRDNVMKRSESLGWKQEQTGQELRNQETDLHSRVIGKMLATGRDSDASAYFKKIEGRIDPDVATKIQVHLQEGQLRGDAQRETDKIMTSSGPLKDYSAGTGAVVLPSPPETLGQALEAARKIEKLDLRAQVEGRVKQRWAEQEVVKEAAQSKRYEDLALLIDQNPGRPPRDLIPAELYNNPELLPTKYRDALMKREPKAENDDQAWLDFLDSSRVNPMEVANMTRGRFEAYYWSKFDDEHRRRAESIWTTATEAVRRKENVAEKLKGQVGHDQIIKNELRRAHVIPWTGELDADNVQKYARFEESVSKEWIQHQRDVAAGKKKQDPSLTDDDIVRSITKKQLTQKILIDRSWPAPNTEYRVAELTEDQRGFPYPEFTKIPKSEVDAIKNQLKSRTKKYSDDKARRLYGAQIIGNLDLYEQILNEKD